MKTLLAATTLSLLATPAFAATIRDFQPMGFACESAGSGKAHASIYLDTQDKKIYIKVAVTNGASYPIHRSEMTGAAISPKPTYNQFGNMTLETTLSNIEYSGGMFDFNSTVSLQACGSQMV